MAKQNGLGQNFYVAGYNVSGDVGSIETASSPRQVLPVTGIDKSAVERIYGRRDGMLNWSCYFNPAAGQAHPALSGLPTADSQVMWATGTAIGDPVAAMVAKQLNYDGTRSDNGGYTFRVNTEANAFGMEWGRMASAGVASQSGAGSLTSYDWGAATSFGLQAYLQVFSFTGTSITVTLEESSDNGAGDAWAAVTGGAFSAVSAARQHQRIQTTRALAVERYLRVTTTGTFSAATFAVCVVRNELEVLF